MGAADKTKKKNETWRTADHVVSEAEKAQVEWKGVEIPDTVRSEVEAAIEVVGYKQKEAAVVAVAPFLLLLR